MKINAQNRNFFYMLLLFTLYIAYLLLRPYLGVIVFALVTVIMFKSVFERFVEWTKGRQGLSTTLTIVAIFVTVLVPSRLSEKSDFPDRRGF